MYEEVFNKKITRREAIYGMGKLGGTIAFLSILGGGYGFARYIWPTIPIRDNPTIQEADLYVVQTWVGKKTAAHANDNFTSDVAVYFGGGKTSITKDFFGNTTGFSTVSSGTLIGTLHLEDHGIGETMRARDSTGKVIASWNEKVVRDWWGYAGQRGQLIGFLGETQDKPRIIMPENIPVFTRSRDVYLGYFDDEGNIIPAGKIENKMALNGIFDRREGTTLKLPKQQKINASFTKDEVEKVLIKVLDSNLEWTHWLFSYAAAGEVYNQDGKLLYRIKSDWWDPDNPASWWSGLEIVDPDGSIIAKIKLNAPSNVKQFGYVFYADVEKNGKLKKLGEYLFHKQEMEGKGETTYWVGELWGKVEGDTIEEKKKNIQYTGYVLDLIPDHVQYDDDGPFWNIDEYLDFALLLLEPSVKNLANAATSADILELEDALNALVYGRKV